MSTIKEVRPPKRKCKKFRTDAVKKAKARNSDHLGEELRKTMDEMLGQCVS